MLKSFRRTVIVGTALALGLVGLGAAPALAKTAAPQAVVPPNYTPIWLIPAFLNGCPKLNIALFDYDYNSPYYTALLTLPLGLCILRSGSPVLP